jgi:hypothetical protein
MDLHHVNGFLADHASRRKRRLGDAPAAANVTIFSSR